MYLTIHRCSDRDPEKIIIVDQEPESEEHFQRLHQYVEEFYDELTKHGKVVTLKMEMMKAAIE